MANSNDVKVVTGKARLCYANVWTPKKNDSGKEVYSVTIVIPKSDTETINLWQRNMFAVRAEIEVGFVAQTNFFNALTRAHQA